MAQENRQEMQGNAGGHIRWELASGNHVAPMLPTPGARSFDLRGAWKSGQSLAGTGALVFEGEVLDDARCALN